MTATVSSLRILRLAHGWTLSQVAQQLRTSVACLSDLERGKGAHSALIAQLAQLYQVEAADLLPALPPGLAELLAQPDMQFSPDWIHTLCRLEFRSGQTLSADEWWTLSESLRQTLS